ncbi:MAG TPA: hypothetical protein VMV14_00585 [Acidimicrobiales bacterium]|nr:hypothetical protein [Acidimicrobiales bacterium]
MAWGEGADTPRTVAGGVSPIGRQLALLGRRYYPVAIAGAFLATVVGFFPSTAPFGLGGELFAAGTPAPAQVTGRPPATAAGNGAAGVGLAMGPYLSALGSPGPLLSSAFGPLPSPSSSPTPTPSPEPPSSIPAPATCPIPVPMTGTQFDDLLLEVVSLCEAITGSQGSLPSVTGLLGIPGAPSVTAPGASGLAVPGASPAVVLLRVVQGPGSGTVVPPSVVSRVATITHQGATVMLVLVPSPGAAGGPGAFGAWVSRTVAAVPGADLVAVGAGAAPGGAAATAALAPTILAGLQAAEHAARAGQRVSVWWGDGGASVADAALWRAMTVPAPVAGAPVIGRLGSGDVVVGPLPGR